MMDANTQETLSESDSDKNEQLIRKTQPYERRKWICFCPRFSYRLMNVSKREAIFMIIFNMSFATLFLDFNGHGKYQYQLFKASSPIALSFQGIVLLLVPIIAFLSDSYVGRYKLLKASLYLRFVAIIFMALDAILLSPTVRCLMIIALALTIICYISCAIPFTIDQLVGASGEQLSFTIFWLIWAWITCSNIEDFLRCYLPQSYQLQQALLFFVSSISFIVAYLMMECCSHVLMTKPQLSNPIKLMAQVLNYARKNKFPTRRSAFTYWEEECPSRIDLGKEKYGGPFTTEEVEDVKTFLRLIPLICCITPIFVFVGQKDMQITFGTCAIGDSRHWIRFLQYLAIILYLPIYQFLIYPFLYNHVPSMLRRIGLGLFLIVFSQLFNATVNLSMHVVEQSHMADTNTSFANVAYHTDIHVPSAGGWLIFSSTIIKSFGAFVALNTTVEFCMAQSPCQVRGLVISVCLVSFGIFEILNIVLHTAFHFNQVAYIILSVVMLGCFVLFVFVSKWYKLRKRDDIIPYHMFAEDQFESDYRQEREWLREHGYSE